MLKVRVRLGSLFLTILLTVPSAYIVLNKERIRKMAKAESDRAYFASLKDGYEKYRAEYFAQVQKLKDENSQAMVDSKSTYNALLLEQQTQIALHTRKVLAGGAVLASSGSGGSSSGSTTTVKKTTKVSVKPTSSRSTSAS